jgi:hypothetical protein
MASSLEPVHQSEQLRYHTTLNLTVHLLTVGSDGIDLINKDYSRALLLSLLKSLTEISLSFTRHF